MSPLMCVQTADFTLIVSDASGTVTEKEYVCVC